MYRKMYFHQKLVKKHLVLLRQQLLLWVLVSKPWKDHRHRHPFLKHHLFVRQFHLQPLPQKQILAILLFQLWSLCKFYLMKRLLAKKQLAYQ
jgi:hypothetical protein